MQRVNGESKRGLLTRATSLVFEFIRGRIAAHDLKPKSPNKACEQQKEGEAGIQARLICQMDRVGYPNADIATFFNAEWVGCATLLWQRNELCCTFLTVLREACCDNVWELDAMPAPNVPARSWRVFCNARLRCSY